VGEELARLLAQKQVAQGLTRTSGLDGLESIHEASRVTARTGERFWQPELLRLRGELRMVQDPASARIVKIFMRRVDKT
jgi:hypothetical protein